MRKQIELGVPRVLTVDLSTGITEVKIRHDLAAYMGGTGLATRLFAEAVGLSEPALAPVQPLVLAIGPLSAAFPAVTKTTAMFKSPLTGNLGESHAGGRLAAAMRFAGYDALVVTGVARRPTYLSVTTHNVDLKDATPLWGLDTQETGRILREREVRVGAGKRSIIRIGPAGESMVAYAGVNVDTWRHFGRLGMGAVMGSKRLKAIVVGGNLSIPLANPGQYAKAYQTIYDLAVKSPAMAKYHELGTAQNVVPLSAAGALPTRNLRDATFESADSIGGEALARDLLLRKFACMGCPVGCIHIGLLREQFAQGYEYRYTGVSYDYELLYSLGSLLSIGDARGVLRLIEKAERQGLDAISTGVVLAWLTEAREKGVVPEAELGIDLRFGAIEPYLVAMDRLVEAANGDSDLWAVAGRGAAALAAKYGGDFDLALSGNEVSGYHTGPGSLLGHLGGARHSHLDAAGYSLDQQRDATADPASRVEPLLQEEAERCMLSSLHVCLFARKIYGDREIVREALASVGLQWTYAQLDELGRSTLRLKHRLKTKMGFSLREARIPERFFQTPTPRGRMNRGDVQHAVGLYQDRIDQLLAEVPPEIPALV